MRMRAFVILAVVFSLHHAGEAATSRVELDYPRGGEVFVIGAV
ncbi:MAG: hypothetical protein NTW87_08920 [Planctomycetota bacterium]|nr:hypothetical protein [Planctomycetota bacterium]